MVVLYSAPDNASLIIKVLLEELNVPYEIRLVDRTREQQASPAYRALNPNGLIPVCVIDGEPIFETAAILMVLAERFSGDRAWMPLPGDEGRAGFLKMLFFLSNTLHADVRQLFYPEKYVGENRDAQAAHHVLTKARILRHVGIFEALCADGAGPYVLGAVPSLLDIYLGVVLRWCQLYPLSAPNTFRPDDFPALAGMMAALETRPALARACASDGIHAPYLLGPSGPDGSCGAAL